MSDSFSEVLLNEDIYYKDDKDDKDDKEKYINNEDNNEDNEDNEDEEDIKEYNDEDNEDISEEDNKDKTEKKKKKKKRHHFSHHIRKILKEICPLRDITQKAKEELNEIMIITCQIIIDKALFIIKSNNKKTMTESELDASIKLTFIGQLCQKSVEEGHKCLKNYSENVNDKTLKGKSRNEKADILVPPSLLDKFLKNQGINVSSNAPIFLAGVIEYFVSQILELANNISVNKNNVRITVYDIENGIRVDKELNHFFTMNNIYLHGSGIIPYIHPSLKSKTSVNDIKSIKIIEKVQENPDYIFPKTCIDNKFKNYIELIYPDARYQKDCFSYFQDYLEKWIIEVLQYSNNITLYSKKTRVNANDIEMAMSIIERRHPSFLDYSIEDDQHFIKFEEKDET
jgi:histone H3/H4